MHGGSLSGWLVIVIDVLVYISLAAAVAVIVSSVRRPRSDFGRLGKPVWIGVQAAYLVIGLLAFVATLGTAFNTLAGALFVVALVQQIAYLLRVVFPSPQRLAARELAATTLHHVPAGDAAGTAPEDSGDPFDDL